jgi:hypothetical protein
VVDGTALWFGAAGFDVLDEIPIEQMVAALA